MKKLFLSLLLMLPLCGFAQKGMQGIGFAVEGGIGSDFEGSTPMFYGASFKYEYNLTDRFRLSTNLNTVKVDGIRTFDFLVKENPNTPNRPLNLGFKTVYEVQDIYTITSTTAYTLGLGFHYFLNGVRPFRPYLFYGVEFGVSPLTMEDEPSWGIKAGLGFNWRLTYNCSLQFECPIRVIYLGPDYIDVSDMTRYRDDIVYYYQGDMFGGNKFRTNGSEVTNYYNYFYNYLYIYTYLAFTPSLSLIITF